MHDCAIVEFRCARIEVDHEAEQGREDEDANGPDKERATGAPGEGGVADCGSKSEGQSGAEQGGDDHGADDDGGLAAAHAKRGDQGGKDDRDQVFRREGDGIDDVVIYLVSAAPVAAQEALDCRGWAGGDGLFHACNFRFLQRRDDGLQFEDKGDEAFIIVQRVAEAFEQVFDVMAEHDGGEFLASVRDGFLPEAGAASLQDGAGFLHIDILDEDFNES